MTLSRRFILAAALAVPVASVAGFYATSRRPRPPSRRFSRPAARRSAAPIRWPISPRASRSPAARNIPTEWKGATWYFASAANRDRFKQNPERWAPQYGGYCAYGVAQGYAVKIEVDQWSVVDGKLYLNYSRSVQRTWKQDIPAISGKRTRTGRKC